MEEFGWRALEIATPIVAAVLVWALGMLGRWLSSKTKNERVDALIGQVQDAAQTAVTATQQAFVSALARDPGAPLSDAQKAEALAKALSALKSVLGSKGLDAVKAGIGVGQAELDAFLTAHIEEQVGLAKPPVTP
jgi:hypothetical protein